MPLYHVRKVIPEAVYKLMISAVKFVMSAIKFVMSSVNFVMYAVKFVGPTQNRNYQPQDSDGYIK